MKLPECIDGMHSSRWTRTSALCLIATLTFMLASCGQKAEEAPGEIIRPVKTATVAAGTNISGLTLPGTVRASQRVELAFKEVGGRLIELPIEGREGQEVDRDELLHRVWGLNPKGIQTRTVDMHIARLREKLEDDPSAATIILTVRSKGYMLSESVEADES